MKKTKFMKQGLITFLLLLFVCVVIGNSQRVDSADHEIANMSYQDSTVNAENDLLYREVQGGSISLEKGDTVNLSIKGKSYQNICIVLVGKDTVCTIDSLDENAPYTYTADVSGEYMIYDTVNKTNITDELLIEFEYQNIDEKDLFPLN